MRCGRNQAKAIRQTKNPGEEFQWVGIPHSALKSKIIFNYNSLALSYGQGSVTKRMLARHLQLAIESFANCLGVFEVGGHSHLLFMIYNLRLEIEDLGGLNRPGGS
jgi:hypothetical protein